MLIQLFLRAICSAKAHHILRINHCVTGGFICMRLGKQKKKIRGIDTEMENRKRKQYWMGLIKQLISKIHIRTHTSYTCKTSLLICNTVVWNCLDFSWWKLQVMLPLLNTLCSMNSSKQSTTTKKYVSHDYTNTTWILAILLKFLPLIVIYCDLQQSTHNAYWCT